MHQVQSYYEAAMEPFLREIAGRPLYMVTKATEGFTFERHPPEGLKHVRTIQILESKGELGDYAVVDDDAGVRELLANGVVEFHPWGTHEDDIENADRIVIDLDPGEGVDLLAVKQTTEDVRQYLTDAGLQSFLRTSGRKGFHVVAPITAPGNDWPRVRAFTKALAESFERRDPSRYTAKSSLKLRPGRIFLDYLRNGRGTTAVASYSLRAEPGFPAALPMHWDELEKIDRPDAFPAQVAMERVSSGSDPWAGIDEIDQHLPS
jgi:bifunctional non-homologous end joining protein LigD